MLDFISTDLIFGFEDYDDDVPKSEVSSFGMQHLANAVTTGDVGPPDLCDAGGEHTHEFAGLRPANWCANSPCRTIPKQSGTDDVRATWVVQ